ncbi:TolC family protein [Emticicia agri]|uniref:TolC family protein n=2 Tax=Emticicia agri TaxID=2492393 RepID=A0A4V1ZCM3_9BACT|nr:TolC family protein [Emticicia agri]
MIDYQKYLRFRKMKFQKITIAILLIFSQIAIAQNANETLSSLVKQAIEYSPRVKEQIQLLNVGDYRIKVQQSGTKPQINGEISYTRLDPIAEAVIPIPGFEGKLQFQPHNNYNTNIAASYVIYDWGRFKAGVQKTLLEMQQQREGIESLKQTLAYQVAQLYYGIIYLQKAIVVQQDQVKLVDENSKIISDRLKSGDALDYDVVQAQVRYKNAEIRVVDLQGQLEKQYIFLSALIGSDAHKQIPANAELQYNYPFADVQGAIGEAAVNNLDIKTALARESALAQEVKISSMSSLPQLAANGAIGIKNGYQPDIDAWRFNTLLGVKLSIPIYTGKRGAYNTQIARINLDAARQSTEAQKTLISRDIENAFNDIRVATQKKTLAERNVYQAEYGLKLAKIRLTNGVSTPLEIQTSETALEDAKFSLLQYDYQILLAKLEVSRLSGVKL